MTDPADSLDTTQATANPTSNPEPAVDIEPTVIVADDLAEVTRCADSSIMPRTQAPLPSARVNR